MKVKISSKGQVVLPIAMRNKLRIKEGDTVEAKVANGNIVLIPQKQIKRKGRIIKDPITGMPALTFGPGAPIITSEWVARMLEDFP